MVTTVAAPYLDKSGTGAIDCYSSLYVSHYITKMKGKADMSGGRYKRSQWNNSPLLVCNLFISKPEVSGSALPYIPQYNNSRQLSTYLPVFDANMFRI